MKISKISIVQGTGTDAVILHTDLPEGCWPLNSTGATFTTSTAKGNGLQWAIENFPDVMHMEIINARVSEYV